MPDPVKVMTTVTIPGEASPVNLAEKTGAALDSMRQDLLGRGNAILKKAADEGGGVSQDDYNAAAAFLAAHDTVAEFQKHTNQTSDLKARFEKGLASFSNVAAMPLSEAEGHDGSPAGGMSPGRAFVTSKGYQDALRGGMYNHEPKSGMIGWVNCDLDPSTTFARHKQILGRAEKALVYSNSAVGGAFVVPQYDLTPEPLARPTPEIIDLVAVQRTTSNMIIWLQQTARATGAAAVSEATAITGTSGTKPESGLAWASKNTPVQTIAHWIPVTNQQLSDAPETEDLINQELAFGLNLALDYNILQGNGTPPALLGILNEAIQSVAFSTAFANKADIFLRTMVMIATANEPQPTAHVINPLDWEPIRVLKTTGSGEYIMGDPSQVGPRFLWGLPVVLTNQMPENTGVTGAWNYARLYMREDSTIKVGVANDDFINNRVRILAELRAAFCVRRPAAFVKATSI